MSQANFRCSSVGRLVAPFARLIRAPVTPYSRFLMDLISALTAAAHVGQSKKPNGAKSDAFHAASR